jgi:hypothetical protein
MSQTDGHATCMSAGNQSGRKPMVTRRCIHCEAEIEVLDEARITCPICGLDPDLPRVAFEDAPAFFFGGDPREVVAY